MADQVEKSNHGVLVLVVGASGVGKDSLLDAARQYFDRQSQQKIIFPRRIITRTDHTGEDHIFADEEEFERRKAAGEFLLDWPAHGLLYGIRIEQLNDLYAGKAVVVNVSRKVIDEAHRLWPRVKTVHITTSSDILRQRLIRRGRESLEDVEHRVARATAIEVPKGPDVDEVDNSGSLEAGSEAFIRLLESYILRTLENPKNGIAKA